MRIFIILFIITLSTSSAFSQIGFVDLEDKPFVFQIETDTIIWNKLERNPLFTALDPQEQWFFYWTNWFRKDPARFYRVVIRSFLKQFPEANNQDVKGLDLQLNQIRNPLPLFIPDSGLIEMSRIHALDLAKRNGTISHTSASGKSFSDRLNQVGWYNCAAENVYQGSVESLKALVLLIIDYGVPGKGHRLNLLDPTFERMGVSIAPIASNSIILVQDFACK
ncbi:MAG: CAP domain-containing protein [Lacibacter sp.]